MPKGSVNGEKKMNLKRKIVRTKKTENASVTPDTPQTVYNQFSKQFRETKTPTTFLRAKYKEIFKSNMPDELLRLIKAKIDYHLLVVEGYQKCNVPVPEKVMKNYKASQEFNIDGFDKNMSTLLKLGNINNGKEDAMATKRKVKLIKRGASSAAKKEGKPRVTVSGLFAEIFAANFKAKLTDEKIAKTINTKIKGISRGHEYCHKDIPTVRRKFNLGLLTGQTGKPKVELEKFDSKKK